jgi:hypothetical protein
MELPVWFVTYARLPSGVMATPVGPIAIEDCGEMIAAMLLSPLLITVMESPV